MTNRKKRLQKGIESIQGQITVHQQKLEQAMVEKDEYLEKYYRGEIGSFERQVEKKKHQLEKN